MTLFSVRRTTLAFSSTHDTAVLQTEDWSDDEEVAQNPVAPADLPSAIKKIQSLENALHKAQQDLSDYRSFVGDRLNLAGLAEALQDPAESSSTHVGAPLRDDDSHYFQSYGENGMYLAILHEVSRC